MIEEGTNPRIVYFEKNAYMWSGCSYLKVNSECTEWLSEKISRKATDFGLANNSYITYQEEVLDEKEKEYLSNLIKPFKKYVKYIVKVEREGQEKIQICYKDFLDKKRDCGMVNNYSFFGLPTFKKGTMYKGMELFEEYTLEELGI